MQYVGLSKDQLIRDEYQLMYDAMKELWTNLLEGKAGYGDDVTRKLQEDVAKIAEELQLDANLVTAEKA